MQFLSEQVIDTVSHAYSHKFYGYPLIYNDRSDTAILILNQTTAKIVKKQ